MLTCRSAGIPRRRCQCMYARVMPQASALGWSGLAHN
jgi:hypothetical protein